MSAHNRVHYWCALVPNRLDYFFSIIYSSLLCHTLLVFQTPRLAIVFLPPLRVLKRGIRETVKRGRYLCKSHWLGLVRYNCATTMLALNGQASFICQSVSIRLHFGNEDICDLSEKYLCNLQQAKNCCIFITRSAWLSQLPLNNFAQRNE